VIDLRASANPPRPSYTARPGEAVRVFRNDDGGFAIGVGRVTIAGDDARFVTAVVGDIGRIAHNSDGAAVIRQGDALGREIRIVKPDPPSEPPNAWIIPDDLAAAVTADKPVGLGEADGGTMRGTGAGCGSTIVYDPADWPRRGDPRSPSSEAVLLTMLRQANRNAAGKSDPSLPDWGDGA
jgi:hypothetical protein